MLNNKRLIKFYKGIVLETVYEYMSKFVPSVTKESIDNRLKTFSGYQDRSCMDMSNFEMQELVELSIFYFAELTEELGERIEIKYPSEI